jgi:ATP-dependent Clp protease adaptor protein ClpS
LAHATGEPDAEAPGQQETNEPSAMTERKSSNPIVDREVAVEEAAPKLKRPSLYRVVLINDDFTPMEFVVEVLETVFGMERNKATRVMLEVHTKGKGICGVFTYEIAETKVAQVMGIAQQQQHPLLCTMEES